MTMGYGPQFMKGSPPGIRHPRTMGIRILPAESERGASLVEMAFLLPLLVFLLVGAIDFGRAYYLKIEIMNAARAGVQYACQSTKTAADTTGIENAATADAVDVTTLTFPTAPTLACQCVPNTGGTGTTTSCTSPSCTSGTNHFVEWVTVYTQASYTPLIRWGWSALGMNLGIPSSMALKGQAVMRVISVD